MAEFTINMSGKDIVLEGERMETTPGANRVTIFGPDDEVVGTFTGAASAYQSG